MQRTSVTVSGFVGADPTSFGREGGSPACSMRVGYTPRYFHRPSGQWRERPTVWITVKMFRSLALNVLHSVHKGDAVVATGSLDAEEWTSDGNRRSRMVLEATAVGHDMSFGTSAFTRLRMGQHQDGQRTGEKQTGAVRIGDDDQRDCDLADGGPEDLF